MTEQILELYRLLLRSDEESFSEVFSNVCARDILAMEHQVQDAINFIMGIGINEKKRAPYMVDRLKDLYKEIGDFIEAVSFFRKIVVVERPDCTIYGETLRLIYLTLQEDVLYASAFCTGCLHTAESEQGELSQKDFLNAKLHAINCLAGIRDYLEKLDEYVLYTDAIIPRTLTFASEIDTDLEEVEEDESN